MFKEPPIDLIVCLLQIDFYNHSTFSTLPPTQRMNEFLCNYDIVDSLSTQYKAGFPFTRKLLEYSFHPISNKFAYNLDHNVAQTNGPEL